MGIIEKQFKNKSLNLTIVAYIDDKQIAYFKGKDIALALGYIDTDQALRNHVDDDDKKTYPVETTGQVKHTLKEVKTYPTKIVCQVRHQIFINESGLYSLIFGSKLESAKKFKKVGNIRDSSIYEKIRILQYI